MKNDTSIILINSIYLQRVIGKNKHDAYCYEFSSAFLVSITFFLIIQRSNYSRVFLSPNVVRVSGIVHSSRTWVSCMNFHQQLTSWQLRSL